MLMLCVGDTCILDQFSYSQRLSGANKLVQVFKSIEISKTILVSKLIPRLIHIKDLDQTFNSILGTCIALF